MALTLRIRGRFCRLSVPDPTHPFRDASATRAIAARIREIIGGQDAGHLELTARRLGVREVALHLSVDDAGPLPAPEVVAAIVREYGVDPTWLLTGEYDSNTHRRALETERAGDEAVREGLVAARITPASGLSKDLPSLRPDA